ncbi:MAG: SDR family NAD(P)-dependent oxidoreductase [Alphaproteobacteria bacterium]|nr:SDR family NAD(P)-dependent oxidoreductase [Alphaproteobacteria bacterium]
MTQFKNILITGASSGIGEALALFYADNGAENLFLIGRNQERLENVAEKCRYRGIKVVSKVIDVTDKENMETFIKEADKIAPLNLVYANAGVSTGAETCEHIYNTFNTNIFGVLNTITPSIEIFEKRKDNSKKAIAITASIAGYHGLPACPSYSATKACDKAYGEALRERLKKENIQVSVICPGFVRSRITDKNTCPMPFFMEASKAAKIIARRVEKNRGLIAFPWPMRLSVYLLSILPNCISGLIYGKLPHKV